MSLQKEKLNFPNSRGEKLSAILERPTSSACAFVLFAHCFTCSKNIVTATRVCSALADRGFATLRFDFTGLGESEGDFSRTNFSSNVDDLVSAASFLASEYQAPSMLVGHSLGGSAVIAAAARLPGVKAVATIAAPSEPAHMQYLLRENVPEIKKNGWAMIEIGGQEFRIEKQFLDDVSRQNQQQQLQQMDKPLLILHSPRDELIDIKYAYQLFEQAGSPKSFVSLDRADHLLSGTGDASYAANMIADWSSRYI